MREGLAGETAKCQGGLTSSRETAMEPSPPPSPTPPLQGLCCLPLQGAPEGSWEVRPPQGGDARTEDGEVLLGWSQQPILKAHSCTRGALSRWPQSHSWGKPLDGCKWYLRARWPYHPSLGLGQTARGGSWLGLELVGGQGGVRQDPCPAGDRA